MDRHWKPEAGIPSDLNIFTRRSYSVLIFAILIGSHSRSCLPSWRIEWHRWKWDALTPRIRKGLGAMLYPRRLAYILIKPRGNRHPQNQLPPVGQTEVEWLPSGKVEHCGGGYSISISISPALKRGIV